MKILLIYYTGTYNTRFLVKQVTKRFEKNFENCIIDKVEITSKTPLVNTIDYDYVGFAYPIYGFNSPAPFEKYVKKLSFVPNQKYFIFKNSGETFEMNNASSRKLLRRMKRKKGVFCGEYHFVMPYNIHFEFDKEFIQEILYKNTKLLDIMFYNLQQNISPIIKSKWYLNLGAFFVGIQKIGGNINSFFYKIDKEKCTKCGLCASKCPHENITIQNNKVKFSHHCDMCMRCSFYCPKKAIHIGFLQGWKVHKYYDLESLDKEKKETSYITDKSSGFYKCFIKYFKSIDDEHDQIFNKTK